MAQTNPVLCVGGPNNCQYFYSMDVNDVAGNNLAIGHYVITESGMQQGGFDWCRALVAGGEYYVALLPDKAWLLNMTESEYLAWTAPKADYEAALARISAANAAIAAAQQRLQTAQAAMVAANQMAEVHTAARHAAEADAARIEGKITALTEYTDASLGLMRAETDKKIEEQRSHVDARTTETRLEAQQRAGAVRSEVAKRCDALQKRLEKMRDPATGVRMPLPGVAESLFGLHREDPLTAAEYHALQLPAGTYQACDLSAYAYATRGKALLA